VRGGGKVYTSPWCLLQIKTREYGRAFWGRRGGKASVSTRNPDPCGREGEGGTRKLQTLHGRKTPANDVGKGTSCTGEIEGRKDCIRTSPRGRRVSVVGRIHTGKRTQQLCTGRGEAKGEKQLRVGFNVRVKGRRGRKGEKSDTAALS